MFLESDEYRFVDLVPISQNTNAYGQPIILLFGNILIEIEYVS